MKKLAYNQLKNIIKECACQAMQDASNASLGEVPNASVEIVVPSEPEIKAGLFPGMNPDHHDEPHCHSDETEQDEKNVALATLSNLSDKALEIRDLAALHPSKEEWVNEKVMVASAMIDSIHDYLKTKKDR